MGTDTCRQISQRTLSSMKGTEQHKGKARLQTVVSDLTICLVLCTVQFPLTCTNKGPVQHIPVSSIQMQKKEVSTCSRFPKLGSLKHAGSPNMTGARTCYLTAATKLNKSFWELKLNEKWIITFRNSINMNVTKALWPIIRRVLYHTNKCGTIADIWQAPPHHNIQKKMEKKKQSEKTLS